MKRLLVKGSGSDGLAAHIPDAEGRPLCYTRLKLADWRIDTMQRPGGILICHNCLRAQAKAGTQGQG
jgi:hypothetical protein